MARNKVIKAALNATTLNYQRVVQEELRLPAIIDDCDSVVLEHHDLGISYRPNAVKAPGRSPRDGSKPLSISVGGLSSQLRRLSTVGSDYLIEEKAFCKGGLNFVTCSDSSASIRLQVTFATSNLSHVDFCSRQE